MAGARGTTLGDAATDDTGGDGGLRCGAGGGAERSPPGAAMPGMMPRDEGGGGMRDVGVGVAPATGRGGMLTGLGTTLMGADGAIGGADVTVSESVEALGSCSSPIENLAAQALRTAPHDCNPKRRYSRTIS